MRHAVFRHIPQELRKKKPPVIASGNRKLRPVQSSEHIPTCNNTLTETPLETSSRKSPGRRPRPRLSRSLIARRLILRATRRRDFFKRRLDLRSSMDPKRFSDPHAQPTPPRALPIRRLFAGRTPGVAGSVDGAQPSKRSDALFGSGVTHSSNVQRVLEIERKAVATTAGPRGLLRRVEGRILAAEVCYLRRDCVVLARRRIIFV